MAKKTQFTPAADPIEQAIEASATTASRAIKATTSTQSTKGRKSTKDTNDQEKEALTYKFNARFTERQKLYLQEKMWRDRTNITQILVDLVNADMKKHPEILKAIDELND